MRVLAVVPARGGSVGVPLKNLAKVGGVPLVARAVGSCLRAELIDDYEQTLANPYIAAERGYVDAVISPHETRLEVVKSLRLLRSKRETLPAKKHGNIPL